LSHGTKFGPLFALLAGLSFPAVGSNRGVQTAPIQEGQGVTSDAYEIYDAVLDEVTLPKTALHATIYDKTLNLKCGEESGNPVLINGCGGLVMPPDRLEQVHSVLKTGLGFFSASTWESFAAMNQASVGIRDGFRTALKHKLIGKDLPEETSPDFTFFLSRPGFSKDKTEALVFVLMFSYVENVPSSGDYFLVRLDRGSKAWKVGGRVQYFVSDKSAN
jgi:hypothetical protein